jgi:FkbM family methyltransferase
MNLDKVNEFDVIKRPHLKEINSSKKLVIFGLGDFAKACEKALKKKGYSVHGFLVSTKTIDTYNGTNVFALDEFIGVDTQVIVGVFNREHPYTTISEAVESSGCVDILFPWDIYSTLRDDLGWQYWLSEPEFLYKNLDKIKKVYNVLGDDLSRSTLLNTVKFRMGLNLDYSLFRSDDEQYFNELTLEPLKKTAINYVDGGAFDGDSYLELMKLCNVGEAYLFEPDMGNFSKLKDNLSEVKSRHSLMPLALSNEYKILSFSGEGEGCHIDSSGGGVKIAAAALDDLLGGAKINFLKLDVEGAEVDALCGSQTIISQSKPVMALSAYHKPQDLWELPDLISSISPDYTFYFRQHYYNSFEFVLYAIPLPDAESL